MTREGSRQDPRPLLPASTRRIASIVLAAALLILVGGTLLVLDKYSDPLDRHVDGWATAHLSGYGAELRLVAELGQKTATIVMIAIMLLACLAARRLNGAVLAAVGAPAASVITEKLLKPLAGHLYSYASYPSGHTTSFFAVIATAAILLSGTSASRIRSVGRIAIVVAAVLAGCAVAIAVIGLSEHHFIDTVGGAAAGTAVVLMATFLLDLPASRRLLSLTWLFGARSPKAPGQAGRRPLLQADVADPAHGSRDGEG
jgi:membrane-associated phospholipid phosphatase